jgi:hypothetical protein
MPEELATLGLLFRVSCRTPRKRSEASAPLQMGVSQPSFAHKCTCLTTIFTEPRHAHPDDISSRTPRGFAAEGPAPPSRRVSLASPS